MLRKVLSGQWKSSEERFRPERALAGHEHVENRIIFQNLLETAEFKAHSSEAVAEVACEHTIQEILQKETVTNPDVQYALDLAALEPTRTARVEKTRGGWQDTGLDLCSAHGPMTGLTKVTQQPPLLARLLTRHLRQEVPGAEFGIQWLSNRTKTKMPRVSQHTSKPSQSTAAPKGGWRIPVVQNCVWFVKGQPPSWEVPFVERWCCSVWLFEMAWDRGF